MGKHKKKDFKWVLRSTLVIVICLIISGRENFFPALGPYLETLDHASGWSAINATSAVMKPQHNNHDTQTLRKNIAMQAPEEDESGGLGILELPSHLSKKVINYNRTHSKTKAAHSINAIDTTTTITYAKNSTTISANATTGTTKNQPLNISRCILDSRSTFNFPHFPHALQTLTICWSFFHSQDYDVCELYVREKIGGFRPSDSDWRSALAFDVMGCQFSYANTDTKTTQSSSSDYHPKRREVRNGPTFWKQDDAVALRERLLVLLQKNTTSISSSSWGQTTSDNSVSNTNITHQLLHIGIVDRRKTRKLVNINQLERTIMQEFPHAHVERAYMENLKPIEQLAWWAKQDVVVAGHGAALSNMVVMSRNTAVIEIFPPQYHNLMFWRLGSSMGIRNYGCFLNNNVLQGPLADNANNTKNHNNSQHQHVVSLKQRHKLRAVDLEPPTQEMIQLVKQAVEEAHTGNYTRCQSVPTDCPF